MLTQKKKQFLLLACTGMLLQLPLPQIGWAANPTDEIHYYSNTYALTQDGSNYANDGATGNYAMAIGGEAKAVGNWSIAIGNLAKATASESIVLGYKTDTGTDGSSKVAIGYQATATGDHGTALGAEAKASGTNSAGRHGQKEIPVRLSVPLRKPKGKRARPWGRDPMPWEPKARLWGMGPA